MTSMSIRRATCDDEPFLWRMLAFAASMTAADVDRARSDPALRSYVEKFGRPGDLGVVAVEGERPIAAAWMRLASEGEIAMTKVWTRSVPELAIAVEPDRRGGGLGDALLARLLREAPSHYPAVMLSVREGSPAVRLYERHGFVVERRLTNRVGSTSIAMRVVF